MHTYIYIYIYIYIYMYTYIYMYITTCQDHLQPGSGLLPGGLPLLEARLHGKGPTKPGPFQDRTLRVAEC